MKNRKIYGILAALVIIVTIGLLSYSIVKQSNLESDRETCESAIHLFLTGSDTLTREACDYADTGDVRHLTNYWAEVCVTENREQAIEVLRGYTLTNREQQTMIAASENSKALMKIEIHALRLIAESEGVPESEMPEGLLDYELTKEEKALSAADKRTKADELLFSREYTMIKNSIVRNVSNFSYYLNERFGVTSTAYVRRSAVAVFVNFLAFLLCVLLYLREYKKSEARRRRELKIHEKCFRVVAAKTGRFVFRFDIQTGTFYHITGCDSPFEIPPVIHDFCEHVIAQGIVENESIGTCRDYFARLRDGVVPPDADMKLKEKDGTSNWYRFCASFLDDSAHPAVAVVSLSECSEQREREMAYSRWLQEIHELTEENLTLQEWNISQDICENRGAKSTVDSNSDGVRGFDERARAYAESRVCEADRPAFLALMNREKLLGMYHSGKYSVSLEMRDKDATGNERWIRETVRLVMYPTSSDIKAYVTAIDISEEKKAELELVEQSELDALTGAYNRRAFIEKVTELFAAEPNEKHLLLMLDIDDFKSYNDKYGHDFGDKILEGFTAAARRELRQNDLVGRLGGDEFVLCLPDVSSDEAMEAMTERLVRDLPGIVSSERQVTISFGAAVFPRDGETFAELYKKADIALYKTKKNGKSNCCFYAPGMEADENAATGIDN